jgi:hypothetical protein
VASSAPIIASSTLVRDRGPGRAWIAAGISRSERTGLPVVHLGTVITTDDVRALDDDQ